VSAFPETIPELLAWRVEREGERRWLFHGARSWTLRDVAREVDRWAVGLAARGVTKGDRVAILLGNRPETVFAWLGANRIGAIAAILNPGLKKPELEAQLRLIDPKLVIEGDEEIRRDGTPPSVDVSPDDPCVLIATSGTTGAPKAVIQTHRAYTLTAEAFPDWVGLTNDDRLLATLPFFHINAQAYSTMGALACGELAIAPKFSASRFWEDAKALGATEFNSVGAMLHILLRTPPRAADREHGARVCYAALALPEALHREFETRFGLRLTVGYGMSETTFGTVWPRTETPRYGTMGKLRQHPRLGVINEARLAENGELWLRNPALMAGYFRDPEQTASAVDADGWLHTGDIVRQDDDGYFTFVSRRKEMLRRRGENIAAAEIENVLAGFEGVREAAVIGVPSDLGEDDIMAYLVLEHAAFDEAALVAHAKQHLADFKVPTKFRVVDDLPRTPTGRVAKHELPKT
jgi:crotonobetaine/carnitine-CoA ligase